MLTINIIFSWKKQQIFVTFVTALEYHIFGNLWIISLFYGLFNLSSSRPNMLMVSSWSPIQWLCLFCLSAVRPKYTNLRTYNSVALRVIKNFLPSSPQVWTDKTIIAQKEASKAASTPANFFIKQIKQNEIQFAKETNNLTDQSWIL